MRKLVVLLALAAVSAVAQQPAATQPERHVADDAAVLDDARENALNERLTEYARESGNRVYVDLYRKHSKLAIESLGVIRAGSRPGNDHAAMLFIFLDDRSSHITARGRLRESIGDRVAQHILTGLRESLAAGDFTTAAEKGTNAMIAAIRDPRAASRAAADAGAAATTSGPSTKTEMTGSDVLFTASIVAVVLFLAVVLPKLRGEKTTGRLIDGPDIPEPPPPPPPPVRGASDKW
ncbi:MAG: TPM domain-containing protein [Thermoanaerobaculia bacterium]